VIIPTVFNQAAGTSLSDVAKLSRGTAVILLLVYAAYLFFQLKTHHVIFSAESEKVPAKPWRKRSTGSSNSIGAGAVKQGFAMAGGMVGHGVSDHDTNEALHKSLIHEKKEEEDEDESEDPQLHLGVAFATLAISTAIIALCAEFMVDSIDSITKSGGLSE